MLCLFCGRWVPVILEGFHCLVGCCDRIDCKIQAMIQAAVLEKMNIAYRAQHPGVTVPEAFYG